MEHLADREVLCFIKGILVEPLPVAHNFVVLGNATPWSMLASAENVVVLTSLNPIQELDVDAGGQLTLLDTYDLYPLGRVVGPQPVDPFVADVRKEYRRGPGSTPHTQLVGVGPPGRG